MLNLEKTSGLPVALGDDMSLEFGSGVAVGSETKLEFSRIKNQLKNHGADFTDRYVYFTYKNLGRDEDMEKISSAGLMFDLFVIPPGKIGEEFIKTLGYQNSIKPGTAFSFPEVYEVVQGQVQFIVQKTEYESGRVSEVNSAIIGRGEKFLVAPGFGVVAVNTTEGPVVLARWCARAAQEVHDFFDVRSGAAYYIIETERLTHSGELKSRTDYVPNMDYENIPDLMAIRQMDLPQFNLISSVPMYVTGLRDLNNLEFLVSPEKYEKELDSEKVYHYFQKEKVAVN